MVDGRLTNSTRRQPGSYIHCRHVAASAPGFSRRFHRALPAIPRRAAAVGWVGEGRIKPATAPAFEQIEFKRSKIAGIVAISEELARASDPAAEELVRGDMVAAIVEFSDRQFLDPAKEGPGAART
jgi:Phage capsid family